MDEGAQDKGAHREQQPIEFWSYGEYIYLKFNFPQFHRRGNNLGVSDLSQTIDKMSGITISDFSAMF